MFRILHFTATFKVIANRQASATLFEWLVLVNVIAFESTIISSNSF